MIRRIVIASTFLFALCSCASYDAGYRQGYADRGQRVASAGAYDGAVIDDGGYNYDDYDYIRNGYYGSYGYPYEFADYRFGSPWLLGFGFGPWFYQPWYGHGYSYGWHHGHHHHHGSGGPRVAGIDAAPWNQQMGATASIAAFGSADGGNVHNPPEPVRGGVPFHERGLNNEPREPHHLSNPRSHRSEW